MAKDAMSIEPGVLDELNRLGADRGPIAGWLAGLEARRESVSASVYQRVREDYTKRIADLDALARPLRIAATRTIAFLDQQLSRLQTERKEVEFDLQEIEFRHSLDEYPEDEFLRRAQVPRERIAELGLELERTRATRELWLAARGGELAAHGEEFAEDETPETPDSPHATQAAGSPSGVSMAQAPPAPLASVPLTHPIPPIPPMPPIPDVGPGVPGAEMSVGVEPSPVDITLPRPIPPPRPSSPAIAVPYLADGATRIGDLPSPTPPAPSFAPAAASMGPPILDRTVVVAPMPPSPASDSRGPGADAQRLQATLVAIDGSEGATPGHALAEVNTIGRVSDNSIQIAQGSVSRHHAILRFTADGWTLEDLEAENGTWVNGERIEKRRLADGDRVNIGTVRFLFKTG